jgi:hypothetical protein
MAPKHCTVADCTRPVTARGWCLRHYQQWRRTGSVTLAQAPSVPRVMLPWRLPEYLVELCRQAAELEGAEPGAWVEAVLLAGLPMERRAE